MPGPAAKSYGTTVVVALEVLFDVFGSLVLDDTEAVFVSVVLFDGGVTLIVAVTVPPLAIVPRLQVTIRFIGWVRLQVPCGLALAAPKAVFRGS